MIFYFLKKLLYTLRNIIICIIILLYYIPKSIEITILNELKIFPFLVPIVFSKNFNIVLTN